jgi:hypothetical protein
MDVEIVRKYFVLSFRRKLLPLELGFCGIFLGLNKIDFCDF